MHLTASQSRLIWSQMPRLLRLRNPVLVLPGSGRLNYENQSSTLLACRPEMCSLWPIQYLFFYNHWLIFKNEKFSHENLDFQLLLKSQKTWQCLASLPSTGIRSSAAAVPSGWGMSRPVPTWLVLFCYVLCRPSLKGTGI